MRASSFSSTVVVSGLLSVVILAAAGCQQGATPAAGAGSGSVAGVTGGSGAGVAAAEGPLGPGPAVLVISGLSCPLCASNIDRSLARVPGVAVVGTDLSNGEVTLAISGQSRPSRAALAKAVEDSGFTLVSIRAGGTK